MPHQPIDPDMMLWLEEFVEEAYRRAGSKDPDAILFPSVIARRTHGQKCIKRVKGALAPGENGVVNGDVVYSIASYLKGPAFEFVVGHEHAHWLFDRVGFCPPNLEACADYVGAALLLRRGPFVDVTRGREDSFAAIAEDFETTQTMVALRIGEVTQRPVAVLAPGNVRARGLRVWPDDRTLRQLASKDQPGLKRVPITDARRRLALVAA